MGRHDNGKLVTAGLKRSGSRMSNRPITDIAPRPDLKRILDKPVMKEIKPVAVKKKPARAIKVSGPTKAKPSKKIPISPKLPATKRKVLVKPLDTNDPPQHALKKSKKSSEPVKLIKPTKKTPKKKSA